LQAQEKSATQSKNFALHFKAWRSHFFYIIRNIAKKSKLKMRPIKVSMIKSVCKN